MHPDEATTGFSTTLTARKRGLARTNPSLTIMVTVSRFIAAKPPFLPTPMVQTLSNKEKIVDVFRRSPLTPLSYTDLKAVADVPLGSFDRTLAALVRDGTGLKGDDGYRLVG